MFCFFNKSKGSSELYCQNAGYSDHLLSNKFIQNLNDYQAMILS